MFDYERLKNGRLYTILDLKSATIGPLPGAALPPKFASTEIWILGLLWREMPEISIFSIPYTDITHYTRTCA